MSDLQVGDFVEVNDGHYFEQGYITDIDLSSKTPFIVQVSRNGIKTQKFIGALAKNIKRRGPGRIL